MDKITSRRNPLCIHMKKLGSDRHYREVCGEFLCDGSKLLEDAVNSDAEIVNVVTSSYIPFPLPVETRVNYVDRSLINYLSPLTNAQDTLFTCRIPRMDSSINTDGTSIALDGVQDPGNVGTIIRTANAFGMKTVILTNNCADPYNPKTIRATMGAIFRQRIFVMSTQELIELKTAGTRFIGTSLSQGCKDISRVRLKNSFIVIGSEGRGLSEEVLSICDENVMIPIAPECESLNASVAAAILIWKATKER